MSECKHEWEPAWIEYEDDVCRICECSKKYWKAHTRIAELKAENARLREENDDLNQRYHLLAAEMVYEGNSVQHWKQKALAYKKCAGFVYEVGQLLEALQQSGDTAGGG